VRWTVTPLKPLYYHRVQLLSHDWWRCVQWLCHNASSDDYLLGSDHTVVMLSQQLHIWWLLVCEPAIAADSVA